MELYRCVLNDKLMTVKDDDDDDDDDSSGDGILVSEFMCSSSHAAIFSKLSVH